MIAMDFDRIAPEKFSDDKFDEMIGKMVFLGYKEGDGDESKLKFYGSCVVHADKNKNKPTIGVLLLGKEFEYVASIDIKTLSNKMFTLSQKRLS